MIQCLPQDFLLGFFTLDPALVFAWSRILCFWISGWRFACCYWSYFTWRYFLQTGLQQLCFLRAFFHLFSNFCFDLQCQYRNRCSRVSAVDVVASCLCWRINWRYKSSNIAQHFRMSTSVANPPVHHGNRRFTMKNWWRRKLINL